MNTCAIKRILQFQTAVQFGELKVFDGEGNDITKTCLYAWSSDAVCWTNWVTYDQYLLLAKNIETDFYLRVLLFGSFSKIAINDLYTTCYTISLDQTNQFLIDFCGNENLFSPYSNLDCALLLQQQLADSIICMFGVPIYYFRVKPDATTADYTFKEYIMHNVESVKQIQLMIPDGLMPSSKPMFSDMDFDWEVDWDVEIGKSQFAKAFGDTAFPKQRDFIYIPMMKRMWEVNSAYDEKNEGLLWRPTTWKLGLIKYNDKTNVNKDDFDEMIDGLIINKYEDVFSELERNEQERESGVAQLEKPNFAATNLTSIFMQDSIRKEMSIDTITIQDKQYNHKSLVVAKNGYSFASNDAMITYQKGVCGDNGTLSFIISTPDTSSDSSSSSSSGSGSSSFVDDEKTIINLGEVKVKLLKGLMLSFGPLIQQLQKGTNYLVICKWNHQNFTSEMNVYQYTYPTDIPMYRIRPEMYSFDFDNPVCEMVGPYNNDYNMGEKQQKIWISGYPLYMTNIKYFNQPLSREDGIRESLKYSTSFSSCVINDVARRLDEGHGYAVR